MDTGVKRDLFYDRLHDLITSKREDNCSHLSQERYSEIISEVNSAKAKCRNSREYRRLQRFDVIKIKGKEKLIVPLKPGATNIQYYVTNEELFDILSETHIKLGHGGRARMVKELREKYINITTEVIMLYIKLCKECKMKKQGKRQKDIVAVPVVSSKLISKGHVDLIDMESQIDGKYKFVLIYQDHSTKFVQLRPLKTKLAEEIASHLLQIFLIFGAPAILYLNEDRTFCDEVIYELRAMWKEVKIIYGRSRHIQTQRALERTNKEIRDLLISWMSDNDTNKWSDGLSFVQFTKNTTFHGGLNRSPYEAMFGIKPKRGIISLSLSEEQLANIENENQLDDIINTSKDNSNYQKPTSSSHQARTQQLKRSASEQNLQDQSIKTLRISKRRPARIGDTVQIQVPENYRGRTGAKNLLAVVIGIEDSVFYKLANKNGTLKELYSRDQFKTRKKKLLSIDEISTQEMTLTEAAAAKLRSEEENYTSCRCKKKCYKTRCSCRSKRLTCNSHCHNGLYCSNK